MKTDVKTLRRMRIEAGKSQFEISRQTGIDRTRLSLAECGHVKLKPDELQKLEAVLRDLFWKRSMQMLNKAIV
jgi:transcriptional regulator with XRE-family HTH domain